MPAYLSRAGRTAFAVVLSFVSAVGLLGQAPQTVFRGGVDLVVIDAQVVDGDGRPVIGLRPDQFEVTLSGKRRRVVSADLVDSRGAIPLMAAGRPDTSISASGAPTATLPVPPPRMFILAVDASSLRPDMGRHLAMALTSFMEELPVGDLVGLFTYPVGPKLDPTADRSVLRRLLGQVQGQFLDPSLQFHLKPSEIVDLSARGGRQERPGDPFGTAAIKKAYCGGDATCFDRLQKEADSVAGFYEAQARANMGMLRTLFDNLGRVPGKKTLVLVSAGMVASDVPGGRPDLSDDGIQLGKDASRANATIYALFVDQSLQQSNMAEQRTNTHTNFARNSEILGRWVGQFTGAADGSFFKVLSGSGEAAFERISRESAAYYVLGIEPLDADRDGRPREVKVRVNQRRVSVSGQNWVVIPKR